MFDKWISTGVFLGGGIYNKPGSSGGGAYVSAGGGFYFDSPWYKTNKSIFKTFGATSLNGHLHKASSPYRGYVRHERATKTLF